MKKFFKKLPFLLLTAMLIGSCSQSDQLALDEVTESAEGNTTGVKFILSSQDTNTTRADAEDSGKEEQGTPDEYSIKNATVYLYDNSTKLFAKSFQLKNLKATAADPTIYESDKVSIPVGTYDIFVVANNTNDLKKASEDSFINLIDSATYKNGIINDISAGIMMTNRGSANLAKVITKKNEDVPISINVERVLARLDVGKNKDTYPLLDNKNNLYANINLLGYYIVNVPRYFYNFRHVAKLTALTEPTWDINTNFGNIDPTTGYAIDPYFFKKTIDAASFKNQDLYYENYHGNLDTKDITWTAFNATNGQYNTIYSLENCMLAPAQKNGYSTGVIFKAKINPVEIYHYNESTKALEKTTTEPDLLYFYEGRFFDSAAAVAAFIGVDVSKLTQYEVRVYNKSSEGYICFYNYWIRHFDNNDAENMGVMEFAIVRNNLYRMQITNITGLGDPGKINPGGKPTPKPDPDAPDEGEAYINIILNVKPWIIRDLTNIEL